MSDAENTGSKRSWLDWLGGVFDDLVIGDPKDPFFGKKEIEGHIDNRYDLLDSEALGRIDSKAAALLTHISMMVAVAAFLVSQESATQCERIILGVEITAYLFFALSCLRALPYRDVVKARETGTKKAPPNPILALGNRRAVLRAAAHVNFVSRWMFLLTLLFALTVLVHLIF